MEQGHLWAGRVTDGWGRIICEQGRVTGGWGRIIVGRAGSLVGGAGSLVGRGSHYHSLIQ